jgi:hypothetical protein
MIIKSSPFFTLSMKIKLILIGILCLMFGNTLSSVVSFAQSLDRVTADKLAQVSETMPR